MGKKDGLESRFSFIIAWDIDENGLTVIDGKLNKVFRLSLDDSLLFEKDIPLKAIRACRLSSDKYIVKAPDSLDVNNEIYCMFDLVTFQTEKLSFELPDYGHPDFSLDGYFVKSNDHFFHVCYKTGFFFAFDRSGRFLYSSQTIDQTGPPIIMVDAKGAKRYHPLTERINRSAYVGDSLLYILSGRNAENDPGGADVIDTYRITTGSYSHSITLPYFKNQAAYDIYPLPDGLLAVYENYMVEYKYESKDQLY